MKDRRELEGRARKKQTPPRSPVASISVLRALGTNDALAKTLEGERESDERSTGRQFMSGILVACQSRIPHPLHQ